MYDDDFLKNLHHVLLEVAHHVVFIIFLTYFIEDTRRRRINDLSKLQTCLPNLQWYPKHGMNQLTDSSFGKMTYKQFASYWQNMRSVDDFYC